MSEAHDEAGQKRAASCAVAPVAWSRTCCPRSALTFAESFNPKPRTQTS
jgi:hypothetical protein